VIYLLLTYLAFDITLHGSSPTKAGSQGALAEVARQPAGPELLVVLAAGLLAYALWRLTQAAGREDSSHQQPGVWKRIGWLASAAVYVSLFAQAVSLIAGSGSSSGGASSHPTPFVATMLKWPAGPELVGLVAVGIAIGGIALAIWGAVHDYDKDFETSRMHGSTRTIARTTGIAGQVTRGLLVLLLAIYLITSAVTNDPAHAKSLDTALLALAHYPYGPYLLGLTTLGLLCFAVFSGLEAAYRKV
jgi:hypothetical protein